MERHVIVQATVGFVESLNDLPVSKARTAKRFLRPLCEKIEMLPDGFPLTSIALSNYIICEERGKTLGSAIGNDKIYGISFDIYYLAAAVLGQAPQICQLLTIVKKRSG
jgi:hypothetical protein